jgi:hypothetical protein
MRQYEHHADNKEYTRPGGPPREKHKGMRWGQPDEHSFVKDWGWWTKQAVDPDTEHFIAFTTYKIYTFEAYEYDTYADYMKAHATNKLKPKVAKADFKLSFDVQMWKTWTVKDKKGKDKKDDEGHTIYQRDENGDTKMQLNPTILQDLPREAAMWAKPWAGSADEHKRANEKGKKIKHGITLYGIDVTTGEVLQEKATDKEGNLLDWQRTFRYGVVPIDPKYPDKDPEWPKTMGRNCSPCIDVHIWGPSGSEGCATTPMQHYVDMGDVPGNAAWETDMKRGMNLGDSNAMARIVLPGKNSPPPYIDFLLELSGE